LKRAKCHFYDQALGTPATRRSALLARTRYSAARGLATCRSPADPRFSQHKPESCRGVLLFRCSAQFAPFEYGFYTGLTDRHGLVNLFRHLHPDRVEHSWARRADLGYRYDHAHGSRVLLLDPADRVLLIHALDPTDPGHHWWELPSGGLDDGEDLRDAARRELAEESGITLTTPGRELWVRESRFRYAPLSQS
jgi:hypothetical protein